MPRSCIHMSAEDRATIIKYAGTKTGEEIATMLGYKATKVLNYACRNKISLCKSGQYHSNAKLTNLQAEMVKSLSVAGFSDTEINKSCFRHVTRSCITGITRGIRK